MCFRTLRQAVSKLCTLSLFSFLPLPMASAQHHAENVTNIVLVHGAWADGSSWSRVIPLLQLSGYHVTAVQLGLTSLDDDVARTKRALARLEQDHPGPVLLVGHSYGGAVITEAGSDPNVVGLVYVAAFAPGPGESVGSISSPYGLSPGLSHSSADSSYVFLPRATVLEDFAQDVDQVEAETLASVEPPTALKVFADAISVAAWATKPSWYVVASEDRMISPELEQALARKMHARTITLHSSHVPMLSQPLPVALFIAKAAHTF